MYLFLSSHSEYHPCNLCHLHKHFQILLKLLSGLQSLYPIGLPFRNLQSTSPTPCQIEYSSINYWSLSIVYVPAKIKNKLWCLKGYILLHSLFFFGFSYFCPHKRLSILLLIFPFPYFHRGLQLPGIFHFSNLRVLHLFQLFQSVAFPLAQPFVIYPILIFLCCVLPSLDVL